MKTFVGRWAISVVTLLAWAYLVWQLHRSLTSDDK